MNKKKLYYNNKIYIITTYETENTILIYFGSNTIYCVDILLNKQKNERVIENGTLSKLRWDAECAVEDTVFERGVDTVNILNIALSYIHKIYPTVKNIDFNDLSTKECNNGSVVNLAGMKFFTDGKTWYEDRFIAKIMPEYEDLYNKLISNANKKKEILSWEEADFYMNTKYLNINPLIIKELYETTYNWQDFFRGIREIVGVAKLCEWFGERGWFDSFLRNILRFHIESIRFYFNVEDFNLDFRVQMIGGKRHSKKNRRV